MDFAGHGLVWPCGGRVMITAGHVLGVSWEGPAIVWAAHWLQSMDCPGCGLGLA